jgi:hypothetical protein
MIGHLDDEYDEEEYRSTHPEERQTQFLQCWDCRYENNSKSEYPCKGCTVWYSRFVAKEKV